MDLLGAVTGPHPSPSVDTNASDIERRLSAPPDSQSIERFSAPGRKSSDVSYFEGSSRSDIGVGNFAGNDCIMINHYHDSAARDRFAVQEAFEQGRMQGRQDTKQEDAMSRREQELDTRERETTRREEEAKAWEKRLSSREKQLDKLEDELRMLRHSMVAAASSGSTKLNESLSTGRYSPDLVRAFGDYAPGVSQFIRGFEFSTVNTGSNNKRHPLSIPFAPFYGDLDKKHMFWLSDHLKVTISSVVRTLQKARMSTDLTWDSAHAALASALHIEETRGAEEWHVCVDLPRDTTEWGQLVKDWIFAVMGTPENGMSLASATTKIFGSSLTEPPKHKSSMKYVSATETIVDVTVLRFPVASRRAFSLSHIRLSIFTQVCKSKSGIPSREKRRVWLRGDLRVSGCFHPRDDMITLMEEDTRRAAVERAEALFG